MKIPYHSILFKLIYLQIRNLGKHYLIKLFGILLFLLSCQAYAQDPLLIKDINATGGKNGTVGSNGSMPGIGNRVIYKANGIAFFQADDGVHGFEMWRSDGTSAGTYLLLDITSGSGSTSFKDVYEAGNLLYFTTTDGTGLTHNTLWRTDGTTSGTYIIMSYASGHAIKVNGGDLNNTYYNNATLLNNTYYFIVTDNLGTGNYKGNPYTITHDRVYKTDGTVSGTVVYYDAGCTISSYLPDPGITYGGINKIIASGGKIYIEGVNNVTYAYINPSPNGEFSPVPYSLISGDGINAPNTTNYAPTSRNFGIGISDIVNVNDQYLLFSGSFDLNYHFNLYRLKPTETTPVLLRSGSSSLFSGSQSLFNGSDFTNGNMYFFRNSAGGKAVTNGEVEGTFDLSGITNTSTLYTGIVNSKMTFYGDDFKLYAWDGLSSTSYQVVSDSLTGKRIDRVIQNGNRLFFLNQQLNPVQVSDLSGNNCLSLYSGRFIDRGIVLGNNYIDFAELLDGSFDAGEEPHALNSVFKIFTGTISNDWNTAGNWMPNGIPTATDDVVIPSLKTAVSPVINGNAVCHNYTTYQGVLTINTGANLDINGYVAQYNAIIKGLGSVTLKGAGTTNYYGSGANFFNVANLNINGIDLNFLTASSIIGSVVNFNTANKILAPFTALTFNNKPFIKGYNNNSYIVTGNGNRITYNGAGSSTTTDSLFTVPIGTSLSSYTPVNISYKYNNGSFIIALTDSVLKGGYSGSTIKTGILNKNWNLYSANIGNNIGVSLGWNNTADELSGFNRNSCYISNYQGKWSPGIPSVSTLNNSLYTTPKQYYTSLNGLFAITSNYLSPILTNLTINAGTLSPVFTTSTNAYNSVVPYTTQTITLTPTGSNNTDTIKVNGVKILSGANSILGLYPGSNVITITVTAQDGKTIQTYTLTVTRASAPVINSPIISYGSPKTYNINTAIASLSPTNTGGAVPATIYGNVTTFAGSGQQGSANGQGTAASFYQPISVTTDAAGNVYVADWANNLVRKIDQSGNVTTFAGSGAKGSANGLGTAASFNYPTGVCTDAAGNLYVADNNNNLIRKISPSGNVITIAGSGQQGSVNGKGTAASFYGPQGITVDVAGNVYVTDAGNSLIRKIDLSGNVTTLAGSGQKGSSNGQGTAASFNSPSGITTDAAGNVYVSEPNNNLIRKISPSGNVTTLSGSGQPGSVNGQSTAASFYYPNGIATDGSGNVYVADAYNNLIRKIDPSGYVTTIAGSGQASSLNGQGTSASFYFPSGIATDASGNLYVADYTNNLIRKISIAGYSISPKLPPGLSFDETTGTISGTPTANSPATNYSITAYNIGGSSITTLNLTVNVPKAPNITYSISSQVYTAGKAITELGPTNSGGAVPANPYAQVSTLAGSGKYAYADGSGTAASFASPAGVATDVAGNVYVADFYNHRIRKISPVGVVTTLAGSGNPAYADGTGSAASFAYPAGVATDAAGNVYVADQGNNRIRKINPAGAVTTLAGSGNLAYADGTGTTASFNSPTGVATDAAGNVYVADENNHRIRKISPAGVVTTLAGSGNPAYADGTGTAASFANPFGVASDAAGNLYVADNSNNRIRKISPAGVVTTLAGSGNSTYSDGTGTEASFFSPIGVATDAVGNVYVADFNDYRIRKISPAGLVTTLAGSGNQAYADGTGTAASFASIYGLATDNAGNLYVADYGNNLIRKISLTGYTISPTLPASLIFDATIGTITGTPTSLSPSTNYTITAYNLGGSSTTTLNLTVNLPSPPVISYNSPQSCVVGSAFTPLTPSSSGIGTPGYINTPLTIASNFLYPYGVVKDASGNLYVIDNDVVVSGGSQANNALKKIPVGGGTPVIIGTGYLNPKSLAIDLAGNIYVCDQSNGAIYKIPAGGGSQVTVYAGAGLKLPIGIDVDSKGNIYVADYGNNAIKEIPAGSSQPIVLGSGFNAPVGIAVDASGNVYVNDQGNKVIKKIPVKGGSPITIGTGFISPKKLAVDAIGNVFVSDLTSTGGTISEILVGGNPAVICSGLSYPQGLTVDSLGQVYVADGGDLTIKKIVYAGYHINPALPSGLTFDSQTGTISGTPTVYSSATNYTITASNLGGSGSASLSLGVFNPAPIITFKPLNKVVYGVADITPGATSSPAETIIYTSSNSNVANITSTGNIHIVGAGTTTITASQAGDNNTYSSATPVSQPLTVTQAALTITADNQTKYYGDDNPTLTYTFSGFVNNEDASVLTTAASITANATAASVVGTYPITVSAAAALNYAITFVPGTLTINSAPAPTITLIDNTTATTGNTIHLTGTYFLGATAVSFGGTAAASFTINSATSITAVVGNGASGSITVTTPSGTGTLSGFNFVPIPTLIASGSTTILSDGAGVTLTANPMSGGYTYQWQNNGVNISGATNVSYTTTQSGNYTVIITLNSVSQTSAATTVTSVFDLTANNYHLTLTGETCNGSSNGTVAVTADASLNYTAILSGNGISTITQRFSNTTTFNNLPAGSYTLTFTVDGQTNYSKVYTVSVTQPQPLSVFATVNEAAGNIELNLSGGSVYHIQLNNKSYTTTESSFSVPLEQGNNALQVSTDRECQGIFTKLINPSFNISPYPMPFESTLNLNLGSSNIATVSVRIYSANTGALVFTGDYQNQTGVLQLDLSKLAKGAYGLYLNLNNNQQEFKIIK